MLNSFLYLKTSVITVLDFIYFQNFKLTRIFPNSSQGFTSNKKMVFVRTMQKRSGHKKTTKKPQTTNTVLHVLCNHLYPFKMNISSYEDKRD